MEKISGRVKSFNHVKGYGFVLDAEGNEYFFHFSELKMDGYKTIQKNSEVQFTPVSSEKGKRAIEIEVIL